MVINPPENSAHIQARHRAKKVVIKQSIATNPGDENLLIELAKVDNYIIQLQFDISQDVDVYLSKKEKSEN